MTDPATVADRGAPRPAAGDSDPEAQFKVADPGKEWRRERGIPIVAAFDGYRALAVIGVVLFHVFEVCGLLALAGNS